jgi:quinol monooxygenase YgiN
LRRAIEAAIPPTREEEGNSVFRLHEDLKMPGHFLLYERFHDQQAVDAHFGAPHFKTLMEEIASLTDGGAKITLLRRLSE